MSELEVTAVEIHRRYERLDREAEATSYNLNPDICIIKELLIYVLGLI